MSTTICVDTAETHPVVWLGAPSTHVIHLPTVNGKLSCDSFSYGVLQAVMACTAVPCWSVVTFILVSAGNFKF